MFPKTSAWRYLWKSEDIRRKLLITILLLVIYRAAANVRVPGIDFNVLKSLQDQLAIQGGFVQFLDLLSGGTVSSFSLLSMGVYPYITAQIIIQLLVPIIPSLQKRMEDNPTEGRKWMEKWTYYLAVPMAALSAIGQINIFNSILSGTPVLDFGFTNTDANPTRALTSVTALLAMMAGTMFAIWLGELISEYGIRGQGLSLIIFAGIVSRIPANFGRILFDTTQGTTYNVLFALGVLVFIALIIFTIVYVTQGRRNVLVMYPGRRVGNRMSMPVKAPLPLMVNMAGMIPLIFAGAILQFPAIIASYFRQNDTEWVRNFSSSVYTLFSGGTGINNWPYWLLYFLFVVGFTFFYATVLFEQQSYGENLKKQGAHIPGVTQGPATQRYLAKVQSRITLPGALFLGVVAVLPFVISLFLPQASQSAGVFLFSSAGLIIVVGVVRDTFSSIDAELKLHGYQESILVK